jgi:hypothetical protein
MRSEELLRKQVRVTIGPDVFLGIVEGVIGDGRDGTTNHAQSVIVRRLTLDLSDIHEYATLDQIEVIDA